MIEQTTAYKSTQGLWLGNCQEIVRIDPSTVKAGSNDLTFKTDKQVIINDMISTSNNTTWRSRLLVSMMLINVAVLLGFVWQIHQERKQQQAMVHAVLTDYAALAGQQFIRQIKSQIGYASMYDLSQLWLSPDNPHAAIINYLETPDTELTTTRQRIRNTIQAIGIYQLASASLTAIEHPRLNRLDPSLVSVEAIKSQLPIDRFLAVHDNHPGLSFTALLAINPEHVVVVNFSPALVSEVFAFIISNRALLPEVLLKSDTAVQGNAGLSLQLNAPNQQTLWQVGDLTPDMPQHRSLLDHDYGEFFIGHELLVGLDQQLAEQLIIGGLPQTQLPRLLALVLLSSGSLLMLLLLLNRDRKIIQQQQRFIARASHELKTPLTQIRLFAETLALQRHPDAATQDTYINIIHKESVRLSQLIENILHQHQIEQGTTTSFESTIELIAWLHTLIQEQQLLMADTTININSSHAIDLTTDANQLKQVLINLLDNAVKFGPPKQTIDIAVAANDQQVSITLTDQGPGIPAAQRPHIWQAYHRLSRDEHRGINGHGLGLSIAQKLVHNLGGNIHNLDCERGACFQITLPLSQNKERTDDP